MELVISVLDVATRPDVAKQKEPSNLLRLLWLAWGVFEERCWEEKVGGRFFDLSKSRHMM
jgi:hypothetical protein